MRALRQVTTGSALVLCLCGVHAKVGVSAQVRDAETVLAAARDALGGEKALAAVRTFVATGRTRQIRGSNLVPIEFEIACELPDKFVRKDEFPAQDIDLAVTGFRGDELLQYPVAPAGRAGGPPPDGQGRAGPPPNPAQQRLGAIKQEFARLTLGVFAASFPSFPLTFTYAAEGEAPEGKADVLDVRGSANFAARLIVQRDTHLPVMLMWQAPGPPSAGGPPARVEHRLYYGEYRTVNGIKWPFRLRRAVAGTTIEETTFDRIDINVRIDSRKFEVPK